MSATPAPTALTATSRHNMTAAPGGLAAVQDFVNTDGGGQPDLLVDEASAAQWFTELLTARPAVPGLPIPTVSFTERDLRKLVELRSRLRLALRHHDPVDDGALGWLVAPGVSAGLQQTADGTVVPTPQGTGWKLVASLLMIESLTAQTAGRWPRLKVCRNEACGAVFYDRSRNNSGVWHDVLICGNAINLRTSRARRRAEASAGAGAAE